MMKPLALTTVTKCNEWLDKADLKVLKPCGSRTRRYAVCRTWGLGVLLMVLYMKTGTKKPLREQIGQQYKIDSAFGLDFLVIQNDSIWHYFVDSY